MDRAVQSQVNWAKRQITRERIKYGDMGASLAGRRPKGTKGDDCLVPGEDFGDGAIDCRIPGQQLPSSRIKGGKSGTRLAGDVSEISGDIESVSCCRKRADASVSSK